MGKKAELTSRIEEFQVVHVACLATLIRNEESVATSENKIILNSKLTSNP